MISGKSVLAIIPAREGSKRIPLKNLTIYRGKPLIQHAIDHAAGSEYIDSIIISSDSDAIIQYAFQKCAKGLSWIKRPDYLASDFASSEAVVAHVIHHCEPLPDYFVLLQPTSPLRTSADIDTCIRRAHQGKGQCISYDPYGKRNGAIYVSSSHSFLSSLSLEDRRFGAEALNMPLERSLDIDYEEDFTR